MTVQIGAFQSHIAITATPGDVLRGIIGAHVKAHGTADALVARAAEALDGTTGDVWALTRNEVTHLRHFLDDDIVGRLAGGLGTSPVALAYRSRMAPDESEEEPEAEGAAEPKPEKGPSYRFIMSDGEEDRAFDIVSQGWDLSEFKSNPIGLYNHDYWFDMPVGHWRQVAVRNGRLTGRFIPTPTQAAPRTVAVADLLRSGTLRTVSVGFRPRAVIPRATLPEDDEMYAEQGLVFVSPRLMECSIVPMPMNPRAALRGVDPAQTVAQRSAPRGLPWARSTTPAGSPAPLPRMPWQTQG